MEGKTVRKEENKHPQAVIETGGKQYLVREGQTIVIEKLPKVGAGETTIFEKVLLFDDGSEVKIGTPYLSGVSVRGSITEAGRGKKITVIKYKPKVRYRVKRGHRQPFLKVVISFGGEK